MTQIQYLNEGNSEAQDKLAEAYLFAQSSEGVAARGVLSGLKVAQEPTASGKVVVGAGAGIVQSSRLAGADRLLNDTDLPLDVLGPNPVGPLPRNDIVVFDAATLIPMGMPSGGTGGIRVILGAPNAVPTDPTVPATAVPLAKIRQIAQGQTGYGTIPTSKIDDLRTFTRVGGGPFAMATGRYTHTSTIVPSSSVGPFPQTFPAGRFTVAPNVTFGIVDGSRLVAYATSITKDGFNLYLRNVSASDSPGGVDVATWQAVQMTPVSADG